MTGSKILLLTPGIFVLPEDFTGNLSDALTMFLVYHSEMAAINTKHQEIRELNLTPEQENTILEINNKIMQEIWEDPEKRTSIGLKLIKYENDEWVFHDEISE